MPALITRPATETDAVAAGLADLLPDHWREGGNRRSVVVTDGAGRVLGHCRGIDNVYHPDSRTLVLEILGDGQRGDTSWADAADALLEAQIAVSRLPLHLKPAEHEPALIDLCARHGAVLVQLMPPWRYLVDAPMRAWAAEHRATSDGLTADPAGRSRGEEMLDLYVEHYSAQHARWSPAAAPGPLRAENAPDFVPGGEDSFDPGRSTVLVRGGRIVAQALVWPPDPAGGPEIGLESRPHEGPTAREDMEACLAAVIDRSDDGDVLLIDSHVTEALESEMMRDLPGPPRHPTSTWTGIVAIPVPGGPPPIPLPADRVPPDAEEFVARLHGGARGALHAMTASARRDSGIPRDGAPDAVLFRPATPADQGFLRTMLAAAFDWREDPEFDDSLLDAPEVAHYLDGWQRATDVGVLAERHDELAGAAWARQLTAADPGYGFVADGIPELTLAVAPAHRGHGIGPHLLAALIEQVRELGLPGLSLSVEDGNRARELYLRRGFTVVGREGNSDTMLLRFP